MVTAQEVRSVTGRKFSVEPSLSNAPEKKVLPLQVKVKKRVTQFLSPHNKIFWEFWPQISAG